MTLRTLNYGNYGIFLIMGHAGFCPSTVTRTSDAKSGVMKGKALGQKASKCGIRNLCGLGLLGLIGFRV